MKRKIILMCLCVSYTWGLFAQEKYDYTNINRLVDKMANNSKTVEESIKNYGQPLSVRTTSAQDYAPNAFEDAVILFHKYKNADFLFFISEKNHKHFLMAWVLRGNFAYFSPLLSNNMTINDVKKYLVKILQCQQRMDYSTDLMAGTFLLNLVMIILSI